PEPILSLEQVKGDLATEDKWILSRLNQTTEKVRSSIENYQFADAAETIYHFFWTEFCDWYIEFCKLRLTDENPRPNHEAARTVLVELLDTCMRLLHPFCPFISEEIWQNLPQRAERWDEKDVKFCAVAPFPEADPRLTNPEAEAEIKLLQNVISMIRNARQESNLPAQKKVPAVILVTQQKHSDFFEQQKQAIIKLALLESLQIETKGKYTIPKLAAVNADAFLEIILPLEGILDVAAEKNRLTKELEKVEKEATSLRNRLNNQGFMAKAPDDVVQQHQKQLKELEQKHSLLINSIARFK
ncbi:MAG: class I tRNA ligase family protein, partial [bacterium]|nr:class I tRNA ligase family protein [bacterium]